MIRNKWIQWLRRSDLDCDVYTSRKVKLLELVHSACGRVDDVEHALVSADLKLLSRLLVLVHRAVHRELLNTGRKRDRSCYFGSGALGGLNNFQSGLVDSAVIIGTEADSDFLLLHDGC